jgi:hypothetical protein
LEGDVVAEGLELGDGSLASAVGVAADEVVATQVLVVTVIGEQDQAITRIEWPTAMAAFLLADASGQPPILGRQVGVAAAGSGPGAPRSAPHQASGCPWWACRSGACHRSGLLPGQRPAHQARCPAVGNTAMSTPISAMIVSAARLPTPVMVAELVPGPSERGDHPVDLGVERGDGASRCAGARRSSNP